MNRKLPRASGRFVTLTLVCGGLAISTLQADEPKTPPDVRSRTFLLSGQAPAEPFVPLNPRTAEDSRRLDAIKQYCIGCWHENEARWSDAIEAYKKALESDPRSLAIHKRLILLTTVRGRTQDAKKFLRDAINLAPDDYELLDRLGSEMMEEEQIDSALEVFKQAVKSPKLDAHSAHAVMLNLKLGILCEQKQDYENAANALHEVMKAMEQPAAYHLDSLPNRPPFMQKDREAATYENMASVFRQAKRYDDALRALSHAQNTSPKTARFALNIAEIYIDQEKYPQALEHLEKYLAERPHGSTAYERLAVVLEKLGREDEILPRVEAAAEKDRRNLGLQYLLGTLYQKAGDIEKAKAIYTDVLKEGAADDRVYKSLAELYQKEDKFRELILLLSAAIEKEIERGDAGFAEALDERFTALIRDPDAGRRLVETAREIHKADPKQLGVGARFFVARVATAVRMLDAAVEFYRLCLAERPQAGPIYNELASLLIAARRLDEAIGVIQDSIDMGGRSRDPDAFYQLAIALQLTGKTDDALKAAARAVDLKPNGTVGYEAQARVYMLAGQYDKAAERYEHILKEFADEPGLDTKRIRYMLSNLYTQLGDNDKAERALEEILAQDPDDEGANNDLGYLWADQGKNLDRALEMIKKAIEKQPDNYAYLDSMGWVLFKLGRLAEARKYLEDALKHEEARDDGTIIDHLGDVCRRLNDPAKARELWEKAAEAFEKAEGIRRDDKKLKEIREKLKMLKDQKDTKGEIKREP